MAFSTSRSTFLGTTAFNAVVLFLTLSSLVCYVNALKFEMLAGKEQRCIRDSASEGELVMVTVTSSGTRGDGQVLNIVIKDVYGNEYARPRDVVGETRHPFTVHRHTYFDVCFENSGASGLSRQIELNVDVGADAKDWDAIQADKKLEPLEADLQHAEETMSKIVSEMEYLTHREKMLRDTNESTNERVKWFALSSILLMLCLGTWQVLYLRSYFKSKHLI